MLVVRGGCDLGAPPLTDTNKTTPATPRMRTLQEIAEGAGVPFETFRELCEPTPRDSMRPSLILDTVWGFLAATEPRPMKRAVAGLLCLIASTPATAEVCDKVRPAWTPQNGPVGQFEDLILFMFEPVGLIAIGLTVGALLLSVSLVLRSRNCDVASHGCAQR
ncbi:hypothetical protein MCEMSEM23_02538 [Rhabdaerophilaceae bacterium]